jgi:hypothetical protein
LRFSAIQLISSHEPHPLLPAGYLTSGTAAFPDLEKLPLFVMSQANSDGTLQAAPEPPKPAPPPVAQAPTTPRQAERVAESGYTYPHGDEAENPKRRPLREFVGVLKNASAFNGDPVALEPDHNL